MRARSVLGRFMFQGTLGKGLNIPFGSRNEVCTIPGFTIDPKQLSGIIRPKLGGRSVARLACVLLLMVLGALPLVDAEVPFDPVATVLFGGLGILMGAIQLFLWTRRCRIAVEAGRVRVTQSQALFRPYGIEVPLAEYHGVGLVRFGEGREAIWGVLLVHDEWAKVIPLAWRRACRAATADVGNFAAALDLQVVETGEEPAVFPADAFNLPLADKVGRGLIAAPKPGLPPVGIVVEWQGGQTSVCLSPATRLVLVARRATFERRLFGRWWKRWTISLADVLGVHIGRWGGFRKEWPAVVLRTADGLHFAGPCPDDAAARWLRAAVIAAAVG